MLAIYARDILAGYCLVNEGGSVIREGLALFSAQKMPIYLTVIIDFITVR